MTSFVELENQRQSKFKDSSPYFSDDAPADGVYLRTVEPGKVVPRSYYLPVVNAEKKLFPDIRKAALEYFHAFGIKWHDETPGKKPSNNLRDSQVCTSTTGTLDQDRVSVLNEPNCDKWEETL